MTRRMERPIRNQNSVQPHPLLSRIEPFILEFLLADRTYIVDAARWIRNRDVLGFLVCFGGFFRGMLWGGDLVGVDCLPRAEPILR